MKYIYHSDKLRLRIVKKKDITGTEIVVLKIQEKGIWFWNTVESLDIEIKHYWGYIPGDKRFGGCLRMSYQMGGYLEVWPPDIIDLRKRANDFLAEYFEANKQRLLSSMILKKQLESLK